MKTLSDRLKFFIENHLINISIREFEKDIGWSASTVNNLKENLVTDKYKDLKTKYPNLNIDWLLTGEGDMLIHNLESSTNKKKVDLPYTMAPEGRFPKRATGDKQIAVYDTDFLAGNSLPMYEDNFQETPAYFMDIPQFSGCQGFRAYSDSMEPKIKSGTILFGKKIETWMDHLEFGQIYGIVCNDNRRYLKYIKRHSEDSKNFFMLVSENTFYDPFEIPKTNIRSIWLIHGWLNKNT